MPKTLPTIYLDSDVFISSLISDQGAAHLLLNYQLPLKLNISTLSKIEITRVSNNLQLPTAKLKSHLKKTKIITLSTSQISKYAPYVSDPDDTHIIAGAAKAKAQFLSTYNLKHYQIELIKRDYNILVYPPAKILQYLRSL